MRNLLVGWLMLLAIFGIASASSISILNTSLSQLNATAITPNSTYQYLNTTYSVNVTDNATLTNIFWYFNNTLLNSSNITSQNITNGTFNYTFNYNFTGTYPLTFIAEDSLNNSVNSTQNITFNQYILPSVSTITPTNSTVNVSQIWQVTATAGSFPISNITWDFQNNFFYDMGFNGVNYQAYAFNQSGFFNTVVQVCDVNDFCSQSQTNLYIASTKPTSYWEVNNANLILNLTPPNQEMMTLTFIPNNDTNSIGQVQVNWGDGSPIQDVLFPSGTTQYTFIHQYGYVGSYNITVTTCDTIGNCYTQFIATVNYKQNVVGNIGQLLVNTNPNTNEGSVFTQALNSFTSILGITVSTAIGSFFFVIMIFMLSILLIIIFSLLFYKFIMK